MFEKFSRIFSRRHKQTTFSDAVFLGALRVKTVNLSFSAELIRVFDGNASMKKRLYRTISVPKNAPAQALLVSYGKMKNLL